MKRPALLGLAAIALAGAVVLAVALNGDDPSPVVAGGAFEFLAHDIIPAYDKASPDPLMREFGGASGVAYVPGSAPGDGSARFLAISDTAKRPKLYEIRTDFSRDANGGFTLETTVLREIPLPHPLLDAESVVILDEEAEFPRYAIAYEALAGVAVFTTSPPEPGVPRVTQLAFPNEVRANAQGNRAFESLAVRTTESGARELWSVMELNLIGEGEAPTGEAGATVRVFVHTINDDGSFTLDRELRYTTEPLPRSLAPIGRVNSVAEAVTLPDGSLAFLERSATVLGGYNGRLFRVSERADGTLDKAPIFDVKATAGAKLPWIGNFEGVCVGPTMAELTGDANQRGHLMLFIADDNFGTDHQRGSMVMGVRVD